jgi:lipopolysaccharide transport system permease protein
MSDLPTRVYRPESALRHPYRLLREMVHDLCASRELAWRLFLRDVRARYRQSILGYVWAFVPPIVAAFTFLLLNRSGVLTTAETTIPYPVYLIVGTLLWQLFADAVASPIKTVNASKAMLSKISLPREAILLSGVLDVLFNFAIRLLLIVLVFAYYRITPPVTTPLAILGILGILLLGLMIGIMVTPVGLLYNDLGQALPTLLSVWMLFTPVVYMPPTQGPLAFLTRLNPVTPLIRTTRDLLTTGLVAQPWAAVWVSSAALLLLFLGWILYRLAMPYLVERFGG